MRRSRGVSIGNLPKLEMFSLFNLSNKQDNIASGRFFFHIREIMDTKERFQCEKNERKKHFHVLCVLQSCLLELKSFSSFGGFPVYVV